MYNIVDRRPNQGRSGPNRQRFLERAKVQVHGAVAESIAKRRVSDAGSASDKVVVRGSGTDEPQFQHSILGGDHDVVLPGNVKFVKNERLNRPSRQGGNGPGNGSGNGDGNDNFEWTLSREEFLDIFFENLELPDLVKANLLDITMAKQARSGFTTSGSPMSRNLGRTMRRSMARRVALLRPGLGDIKEMTAAVDEAVASGDADLIGHARAMLEEALKKMAKIPWIDPVDVRYNRFSKKPEPIAAAVMFCLMDVSGSMNEHMKDLAKRFFMLLFFFLERKYEHVNVVFIRHTETAKEVDEDTFFRSTETGGTVVSSALVEMLRIQEERFPVDRYNIYVAQASDGDNSVIDSEKTVALMRERILPIVQHMAFIETSAQHVDFIRLTTLWETYLTLGNQGTAARLAMRGVRSANEIWGVFSDLFTKKRENVA